MVQWNSSCRTCRHHLVGQRCMAFPEGIPDDIWTGRNPHTEPVDGDHGIRYEPLGEPEGSERKGM